MLTGPPTLEGVAVPPNTTPPARTAPAKRMILPRARLIAISVLYVDREIGTSRKYVIHQDIGDARRKRRLPDRRRSRIC
jgi:hypothetical protein